MTLEDLFKLRNKVYLCGYGNTIKLLENKIRIQPVDFIKDKSKIPYISFEDLIKPDEDKILRMLKLK